jgi:hypothetical protein
VWNRVCRVCWTRRRLCLLAVVLLVFAVFSLIITIRHDHEYSVELKNAVQRGNVVYFQQIISPNRAQNVKVYELIVYSREPRTIGFLVHKHNNENPDMIVEALVLPDNSRLISRKGVWRTSVLLHLHRGGSVGIKTPNNEDMRLLPSPFNHDGEAQNVVWESVFTYTNNRMLLGFGAAAPLLEAKSKSGQHVTLLCRP